jgi:hypothetical protein
VKLKFEVTFLVSIMRDIEGLTHLFTISAAGIFRDKALDLNDKVRTLCQRLISDALGETEESAEGEKRPTKVIDEPQEGS